MSSSTIDTSSLVCCISQDWLDDPVLTTCGHLASRAELATWLTQNQACPKCRNDLSDFKINDAPVLYDIKNLVEQAKSQGIVLPAKGRWKADLICLHSSNSYQKTKLGKLVISNTSKSHQFRTLLIPVIDHSGSMQGSPITQAQKALESIVALSYARKNLVTNIVAYHSVAKWHYVDTTMLLSEHTRWINDLSRDMQGTSFTQAFDEIIKVCEMHKNDASITSIEIVFLTDGEDQSHTTTATRLPLLQTLKTRMNSISCKKPWRMHAIGFGVQHDHVFLDNLRKIGSENIEGAYRYAIPDENIDSLLGKIQSVVNVIAEKSAMPIRLVKSQTPMLQGESTVYYMDVTDYELGTPYSFTIDIDGKQIELQATCQELDQDAEIREWELWFGLQIDKLAKELQTLTETVTVADSSQKKSQLNIRLHFEFLLLRARGISARLCKSSEHQERLNILIDMIRKVQLGESVDSKQLKDLSFEGKFKTVYSTNAAATNSSVNPYNKVTAKLMPTTFVTQGRWVNTFKDQWTTFEMSSYTGGLVSALSPNELLKVMATGPSDNIISWLDAHRDEIKTFRDSHDCTILAIASSFNRGRVVEWILNNVEDCALTHVDQLGNNAMDLSIINGTWFSFERLYNKGLRPSKDIFLLLRSCLTKGHDHSVKITDKFDSSKTIDGNKYFKTASLLFKTRLILDIDKNLINAVPFLLQDVATWLTARSESGMSLQKAVQMGLSEMMDEIIQRDESQGITHYSLQDFFGVFARPTPTTVQMVEKLVEMKKIDINETVIVQANVIENNNVVKDKFEDEDSWPLYAASEKGRLDMVQMILKHDTTNINRVNKKHVTTLWIAACNNHIDVVLELLSSGADPNICTETGSSALIHCCRKGYSMMAQLLLDNGISLDHYAKERDHPILQCCRDGQGEVLKVILDHLSSIDSDKKEIERWFTTSNPIDGFVPLHAATELGHTECVRICNQYGANLEYRTDEDNQIIGGATAVHIAAFNGRVQVVQLLRELGANFLSHTTVLRQNIMHLAVIKKSAELVYYLRSTLTPEEISALNVKDIDGHTPSFYAHCTGNELLRDEFFTDRLSLALEELCTSDEKVSASCVEVIESSARTVGCFDYDQVVGKCVTSKEIPLLTKALLSGNAVVAAGLHKLGADWYQTDSNGLSPRFWSLMMMMKENQTKLLLESSSSYVREKEVLFQQLVDKVNTALKVSAQCKLLLNISRGPPQRSIVGIVSQESTQIQNSSTMEISPQALVDLRSVESKEISLMGWVEKTKQQFPLGKQAFEHLIWDAKVHVITLLAKKNVAENKSNADEVASVGSLSVSKSMNPLHLFVLYLYTADPSIFKQVNEILANWQKPSNMVWKLFVSSLYQTICSLPVYEGECFLAAEKQEYDEKTCGIGAVVNWKFFTMTSLQWDNCSHLLSKKQGVIYIVKSRTGRIIAPYSAMPADSQCIFLPDSKFVITNHYIANPIALQQSNIRQKTYKLVDYEKVKRGKACMLIELQEENTI